MMTAIDVLRSMLARCGPAAALLGAILLTVMPLQLSLLGLTLPMPLFPMIVVFLYAVYDPDAMPAWVVFTLGLFHDVIYGGALGVWASVYVGLQFLVMTQRDYFRGRVFHVLWLAFVLALLAVGPVFWLERSLIASRFLSPWPLLGQFALTAAVYPAVAWVFFALRDRALREVMA